MGTVEQVTKEDIEAALVKLEATDVEAANAFRCWMDAYYLFDATLDAHDYLLSFAQRARELAAQAEELAARFVDGIGEGEG